MDIQSTSIRVACLGEELMAGETCGKLRVDESTWSFVPAEEAEGGTPELQLDLVKKATRKGDEPVWGYVLLAERAAAR